MIKKLLNPKGLFLSLPMIVVIAVTALDYFPGEANNTLLTIFIVMFILTLPWSIPLAIIFAIGALAGGALAYLSYFAMIVAVIFAHINALFVFSIFSTPILEDNTNAKNQEAIPSLSKVNFLKYLLNGDFGLTKTFWIYFFIIGNLLFRLIPPAPLSSYAMATVLFIIYEVIIIISTWRAANKYQGSSIWRIAAKLYTFIIGIILFYLSYTVIIKLCKISLFA